MSNMQENSKGPHFSKTILGYNTAEVDDYIRKITENYNAVYRANVKLEKDLTEALSRLENVENEEKIVKQTLERANVLGSKMIADAQNKANGILTSVKKSSDAILASFREKAETAKTDLTNLQENVVAFKNELFEKYRMHIEQIDNLIPAYEYEGLTSENYINRVVTNMKREIAAEYDLKLEDVLTEEEKKAFLLDEVDSVAKVLENDLSPKNPSSVHSKNDIVPSVMEMLNEYEEIAKAEAESFAKQLSLDVDALLTEKKAREENSGNE